MQVQNAIWDGSLQAVKEWDREVARGKVLLETRQSDIEDCLLHLVTSTQSDLVTKVKWFLHPLFAQDESAANHVLGTPYPVQHLTVLYEMLLSEFDLKAALAGQNTGPVEKRKLLILTWTTQPHIDRKYLDSLIKSPFN